jgi:hypothetical protein
MRDLAERFDNVWLAATSRVLLGSLAMARGRLHDARAVLDEGMDLSLQANSTFSVALCLAAFAQLAFAEGNPRRAALVAGAADGPSPPSWPARVCGASTGRGRGGGSDPSDPGGGPVR